MPAPGGATERSQSRLAARRFLSSLAVGVVAGGAVSAFAAWQVAVAGGWCVTAVLFLARLWPPLLRFDATATASHAQREDDSRLVADVCLLAASTMSLAGVGFLLVKGASVGGHTEAVYTAVAVLSVVSSWAVVHSVFALRYARLYYADGAGHGIGFNEDAPPRYSDFAYVAFTIGMTYQVSDTDLQTRAIRSTALRHALLSYLFGTAIIAMTINVVAGLVK